MCGHVEVANVMRREVGGMSLKREDEHAWNKDGSACVLRCEFAQ